MTPTVDLPQRLRALQAEHGFGADPSDGEGRLRLLRVLYGVGRQDLPLGRLLEGHVDALQIVHRYGSQQQVSAIAAGAGAGAILGVWNADLPGDPLRLEGTRVSGGKSFASGAGVLSHALVTAEAAGGRQLLLLDIAETPPEIDRGWWRTLGMQRSETHRVRWSAAEAPGEARIGAPGDYVREPHFTGGALRFAAVQAGGVAALFDHARDHLLARGRAGDPLQAARLCDLFICAQTAADAVRGASDVASAGAEARWLAQVGAARVRVAQAADRAIALAEQAVGVDGLFLDHPLAPVIADLSVYLRQPAPDAQRLRVAAAAAAGEIGPSL